MLARVDMDGRWVGLTVCVLQGVCRRRRHRPGLPLRRGVQPWLLSPQTYGPIHPLWYSLQTIIFYLV